MYLHKNIISAKSFTFILSSIDSISLSLSSKFINSNFNKVLLKSFSLNISDRESLYLGSLTFLGNLYLPARSGGNLRMLYLNRKYNLLKTNLIVCDVSYEVKIHKDQISVNMGSPTYIDIPEKSYNQDYLITQHDLVITIESIKDNITIDVFLSGKIPPKFRKLNMEIRQRLKLYYNLNNKNSVQELYNQWMQDQDPIGDISGDGILDILDLIIIIDFILEEIFDINGDINFDGGLNIQDIVLILNNILGR